MNGMKLLTGVFTSICATGLLFVGLVTGANAFPVLRVIHPDLAGGMLDVTDTDMDGLVQYSGSVGGFFISANIGSSYPLTGDAHHPKLDLFSMEITSNAGGTGDSITVMLTDTGFIGGGADPSDFLSSIGGTTDGLVTAQAYIDGANAAFGMGTPIAAFSSDGLGLGLGAFGGASSGYFATSNLYSLTLGATVTHDAKNQSSSFDFTVSLPEPGTIALLGLGLLGLAFVRKQLSAHPARPRF